MPKRIPDIFLSPRQLVERAQAARRDATKLRGIMRDRLLKQAEQDETMAQMKRLVGDADDEAPNP